MLALYTYFRSSAAYRVRIALALKGLAYETRAVHLLRQGGEQRQPAYLAINPAGIVPALVDGDVTVTQSLAIIEYLEDTRPTPPLLPRDPVGRARVRALAQSIACEIHPLNNLRVLQRLEHSHGLDKDARRDWYHHWIHTGFSALETALARDPATGRFVHGDHPGLVDCCLVPQMANARRFEVPLDAYPTLVRIDAACRELDAFQQAAPERQPDAE